MYGIPNRGYGCEIIGSINTLIDAIKARQVQRPNARLALHTSDGDISVKLLRNGFIEFAGTVIPPAVEKQVDRILRNEAALLIELTG